MPVEQEVDNGNVLRYERDQVRKMVGRAGDPVDKKDRPFGA